MQIRFYIVTKTKEDLAVPIPNLYHSVACSRQKEVRVGVEELKAVDCVQIGAGLKCIYD